MDHADRADLSDNIDREIAETALTVWDKAGIMIPPPTNSKFTAETKDRILEMLGKGVHRMHAAQAAGISLFTMKNWTRRGTLSLDDESNPYGPDAEYGWFLLDMNKAEAESVERDFDCITRYADGTMIAEESVIAHRNGSIEKKVRYQKGDWQAAAWKAERVHDVYKQTRPEQQISNREVKITTVYVNDWREGNEARALVDKMENGEVIESQFASQDEKELELVG